MREKNIDQLPLLHALTWDRIHNPGLCPDQELNRQSFTSWDQPTAPRGPWLSWPCLSANKKAQKASARKSTSFRLDCLGTWFCHRFYLVKLISGGKSECPWIKFLLFFSFDSLGKEEATDRYRRLWCPIKKRGGACIIYIVNLFKSHLFAKHFSCYVLLARKDMTFKIAWVDQRQKNPPRSQKSHE